jgi:hypothetical protein
MQIPACSPMQRRSVQDGKVTSASPAMRINFPIPPRRRSRPRPLIFISNHENEKEDEDEFQWNVNRTSEPGLGANECVPLGKWCESTAFRQTLQTAKSGRAQAPACSSKRTVRLISGIALDQCRVRKRYPARRPFLNRR